MIPGSEAACGHDALATRPVDAPGDSDERHPDVDTVPPGGRGAVAPRYDRWSSEEDSELISLCTSYRDSRGRISWVRVVPAFQSIRGSARDKGALMRRWRRIKDRVSTESVSDNMRETGSQEVANPGQVSQPTPNRVDQLQQGENIAPIVCENVSSEPQSDEVSSIGCEGLLPRGVSIVEAISHNGRELGEVRESTHETVTDNTMDPQVTVRGGSGDEQRGRIDVPVLFRKKFSGYFGQAVKCFNRKPIRRSLVSEIPKELLAYGDALILRYWNRHHGREGLSDWGLLNALVYSAGATIEEILRVEALARNSKGRDWFRRREQEVLQLESECTRLRLELQRRRLRQPPKYNELRYLRMLRRKYGIRYSGQIAERLRQLEERLVILKERIKLRKSTAMRQDLRLRFAALPSMKVLWREQPDGQTPEMPPMDEVYSFWEGILGTRQDTDPSSSDALLEWRSKVESEVQTMNLTAGMVEDMCQLAIAKMKSFRAPGLDGIYAFWWKILPTAKRLLCRLVVQAVVGGSVPPVWVMKGRTVLIYKKGDRTKPENYRPITCLNTCYKAMTSVVNKIILAQVTSKAVLCDEQRALKEGEWACIHALLRDKAIVLDAVLARRPLSVAWLDFAKAFDSVSHSYLLWLFDTLKLPQQVRRLLSFVMRSWSTRFQLGVGKSAASSPPMKILNGIFQGDALSPTLFVLSLAPISYALSTFTEPVVSAYGGAQRKQFELGHQFYVDDLKLYARTPEGISAKIDLVCDVARYIGVTVNPAKCAIAHKDRREDRSAVEGSIAELPAGATYRYLGLEQALSPEVSTMDRFLAHLFTTAKVIFESDLTWHQKTYAFRSISLGGVKYAFLTAAGATVRFKSAVAHARETDTRIRDLLVQTKARYRDSCTARLYLSCELGGCGMASVEDALEDSVLSTFAYYMTMPSLACERNFFIRKTLSKKRTPYADAKIVLGKYAIVVEIMEGENAICVDGVTYTSARALSRRLITIARARRNEMRLEAWKALPVAGVFWSYDIDHLRSILWLKKGFMSSKVMRDALAVQEGALITRSTSYVAHGQGPMCRKCHHAAETIGHIVSACSGWLASLYISRHDAVCRCLYALLCKIYGFTQVHWAIRIPHMMENEKALIMYDSIIQTLAPIKHRRPDFVVHDKLCNKIKVFEISVATPLGINHQRAIKINRYCVNSEDLGEAENQPPYPPGRNLVEELRVKYNREVIFVPLVVGTSGEHSTAAYDELHRSLGIRSEQVLDLLERCSRSAVEGTHRVIANHLCIGI